MQQPQNSLRERLARLEKRLRHDWAQEAPPLPSDLLSYKEEWLRTLSRPTRTASPTEVKQALLAGNPIVVGDFHTMRRSRSSLAWLLHQAPEQTAPGLLLELLPQSNAIPAKQALKDPALKLVDGRTVRDVYESSLRSLSTRNGLIAGAWVDSSARQRDHQAAQHWQTLQQQHPSHKWLLFFGDWHLADGHLPRALRRVGANPQVLHQSPEPLWERSPQELGEQLLKVSPGHWAWLHTPPLAHWASSLQASNEGDHEFAAEITEEIVSTLVDEICHLFEVPLPSTSICAWPEDQWKSFRATLPALERHCYKGSFSPKSLVVHPHFPAIYATSQPAFNQLVEAAAHCIACDYPIHQGENIRQRLSARAFRRLPACLLNQFLRSPNMAESGNRLLGISTNTPLPCNWAEILGKWQQGEFPTLDPMQQVLAIEVFGAQAGHILSQAALNDPHFIKQLLTNGFEVLDWEGLSATMLAA